MTQAAIQRIIAEEVHWALFKVHLPDIPWSKAIHEKRACESCGKKFDPVRWFSRFCSRKCYSRDYNHRYHVWKKRVAKALGIPISQVTSAHAHGRAK